MIFRVIIFICWLLALSAPSFAEKDAIDRLIDTAVSFFTPVKGRIVLAEDETITADIGGASGVKVGMRLTVLREGEPFVHPITKEPIGVTEKPVGLAEVVHAGRYSSMLTLLEGEARAGDILRMSSAQVRALFYTSRIGWDLSEEYYLRLKETGRFELLDASPKSDLAEEAKRLNAEVAIVLSTADAGEETLLTQRLVWAKDSKEFSSESVGIGEALGTELKLGRELFELDRSAQFISFDIPFSANLIATGDFDGNGTHELAMSDGRVIVFYSVGASLKPELGDAEIKGRNFIWMDVHDLDGDGRDELVATDVKGERVTSYVYKYVGNEFSELWKGDIFVRVIGGKLYGQEPSAIGGYKGEVFTVNWDGEETQSREVLTLPPGVNLYDFRFIKTPGGSAVLAYGDAGYLTLYDKNGVAVWQSSESYGGAIKSFKKESPTVMVDRGEWSVKDRLLTSGRTILAVKRTPLASMVKGIGYKSSEIVGLLLAGNSVQETTLFGGISGKALDYTVFGDRLFVLASPIFGIEAGKILKGRNPITTKLYIYTLKGS
jgi:hypothetical protein